MVELQPSKLVVWVRFPSPAFQSRDRGDVSAVGEGVLVLGKTFFEGRSSNAAVAQSVECVLGKDEVMGSNPISSFGMC